MYKHIAIVFSCSSLLFAGLESKINKAIEHEKTIVQKNFSISSETTKQLILEAIEIKKIKKNTQTVSK